MESNRYRREKATKAELSVEQRVQRKYVRLEAQLSNNLPENALKTAASNGNDSTAKKAQLQLLLTLERFSDALKVCQEDEHLSGGLEHAYALCKLAKYSEALALVQGAGSSTDDRASRVLEAQIRYKNEDFLESKAIYDELLLSAEIDSPEYADLETNTNACEKFISFQESIQDRLADAKAERAELDVATLETRPPGPLIQAHFKGQTVSRPAQIKAQHTKAKETPKKPTNEKKLPKRIAEMAPDDRPPVDPERWLPKRERKAFISQQDIKREAKRKQKAKKTATQGAAETNQSVTATSTQSTTPAKKKKGKR